MWTNPKKYALLPCAVVLLALHTLSAQTDTAAVAEFRPLAFVGIQYGNSWNTVDFSPPVDQSTLTASRIGLQMRYEGEANLGLQVELALDGRGWAEAIDSVADRYERALQYLDLGLYSHIGIGKGRVKPFVLLGSYLSFPLSDEETLPADWPRTGAYYGEALPKRIQYGLAGGLGIEVIMGRIRLQLDGRYRSALGGLYPAGESAFTFSNGRGLAAQAAVLYRL